MQKTNEKNIYCGTGLSDNSDSYTAGKESVENAFKDLGNRKPSFAYVFCSGSKYGKNDEYIKKLVAGVSSQLKDIPWVGCTTCGEIIDDNLSTKSCICLIVSSEFIQIGIGIGEGVLKKPRLAGKKAIRQALANFKQEKIINPYVKFTASKTKNVTELLKMYEYFFFMFSPGLTLDDIGHEDEVLKGVVEEIGRQYPIIGGTSGDDLRMLKTYQFANGKFYSDAAVILAVSTGLRCGFGFDHGYTSTGKMAIVNKSSDYMVHELDNKPALDRYSEILGITPEELWDTKSKMFAKTTSLAKVASKYFSIVMNPKMIPFLATVAINPFGIADANGNLSVRIAKGVKNKSIEFCQIIPQNVVLQNLKIDPKRVMKAEMNALKQSIDEAGADPAVIFVFDCELRKIYTGEKNIHKAITNLKKKYPKAKIFGFNTSGEFTYSRTSEPQATSASVSVGVLSNKLVTE